MSVNSALSIVEGRKVLRQLKNHT